MAYATLQVKKDGAIDWLTLNRPEALNALDDVMIAELNDYFGGLAGNESVRVVAMRGAGNRAFCAGWDTRNDKTGAQNEQITTPASAFKAARVASEIVRRMRSCPQPIVTMINGAACGGFALVAASDIRIAVPSARMNAAFIKIGLSGCDMGLSYHLPRLVGAAVASELMLTGRFINAQRALSVGLVSEIVADELLAAAAQTYLDEMLAATPLGLKLTKECLNMNLGAASLDAASAMEDRNQALCLQSQEFRERMRALTQR